MSKQYKIIACITCVLAVLFYLFFQVSKHQSDLARVNVFAADPYDAVGSFGVQFAVVTALLLLVRAFRPYQAGSILATQQVLFVRNAYITCFSIVVTLIADAIAMIRYPSVWIGSQAGYILAMSLGGLLLLTALACWFIHYATPNGPASVAPGAWIRTGCIALVSILILATYPASWQQSIHGALFTALTGLVIFFVAVWAWVMVTIPVQAMVFEDFIDDLASIYRWLKGHAGYLSALFTVFEKMRNWSLVSAVIRWLNPRQHPWNSLVLIGIFMGAVLALAEAVGEGGPGPRFAMVVAVFIGLESAGILLGYALIAQPLGLFRHDARQKADASVER